MLEYENVFRVLSMDPGSNCTGFCVLDYNAKTGKVVLMEAYTAKRNNLIRATGELTDIRSETSHAVYLYGNELNKLLNKWLPTDVVSEAAFFKRFPQPFKVLTSLVTTFRNLTYSFDPYMFFTEVPPLTVKHYMGVSHKKKKTDPKDIEKILIRKALYETKLPLDLNGFILDDLDEHTIDAICIGLWLCSEII